MLTKQSHLKELIDQVASQWFKEVINEKIKHLRVEFQQLQSQIPLLMQLGDSDLEIETSIMQIQNEVNLLKTFNDLKVYTKTNAFSTNDTFFKNNNLSFETLGQFLQQGESITKLLVKIKLGESFTIAKQVLDKIQILDTKIGFEVELGKISLEDIDYLLGKSTNQWEEEILHFVNSNAVDAENVLLECNELINSKNWDVKLKNLTIIERYFSKFKATSLFESLTSPQDLQNKENQEKIIAYSKIIGAINSLNYLLKLNKAIIEKNAEVST